MLAINHDTFYRQITSVVYTKKTVINLYIAKGKRLESEYSSK
jgi:hypothetical protein